MAKIQDLLEGKTDQIDFIGILKQNGWIIKRDYNCILSPDSDGFLCGLFMSYYFNWKIVGFYDGKVLLLNKEISSFDDNCAFLDVEIFRETVKSIGHHMLKFNQRKNYEVYRQFKNTIQPNLLRNYDGKTYFRLKYPLATIHLLIAIASQSVTIDFPDSAIAPLFFVDGTFNVLYSYPENVLNWLNYLRINEPLSPLRRIFMNNSQTVYTQMLLMDDFFRKRDVISIPNERGDRLRITNRQGDICNVEQQPDGFHKITDDARDRCLKFIDLLSSETLWPYNPANWIFNDLEIRKFSKSDFTGQNLHINNKTFEEFILKNPLSWAMTSNDNIEYTLEEPDKLK